jgi:hypothetical protein
MQLALFRPYSFASRAFARFALGRVAVLENDRQEILAAVLLSFGDSPFFIGESYLKMG